MHVVTLVFANEVESTWCELGIGSVVADYKLKRIKSVIKVEVIDGPKLVDDLISEGYLDPAEDPYFIEGIE